MTTPVHPANPPQEPVERSDERAEWRAVQRELELLRLRLEHQEQSIRQLEEWQRLLAEQLLLTERLQLTQEAQVERMAQAERPRAGTAEEAPARPSGPENEGQPAGTANGAHRDEAQGAPAAPAVGGAGAPPGDQEGEQEHGKGKVKVYVYLVAFIAAMGGFLFGYDTGVISGAQQFLKTTFHFGSGTQEFVVSSVLIGAVIGAAGGGKLADWIGRRMTLIIMGIIFAVGAVLTAIAPSLFLFIIFRILVGIGIGASSVVAPMYTTELAPPGMRGKMVFIFQFFLTLGILIAYVVDIVLARMNYGWRPMFGLGVIPAAVLAVGMFFLSDTPRWFGTKGRWDEARAVASKVTDHVDEEIQRIRKRVEAAEHSSWTELFKGGLRLALIVGVCLAAFQQLTGINTIIYYAPIIAGYSGIGHSGNSLIGAVIVGIVNVAATAVAIFLVDRVGRRILLLTGISIMIVTLAVMGYLLRGNVASAGIPVLIVLLIYIIGFAIGLGPVYWLLSSEIFPTRLRGTATGASTTVNWGANLAVTLTYLTMIASLGRALTFWIYATFGVAALVFVWRLVPETKNRPLELIEDYWSNDQRWPESDDQDEQREQTDAGAHGGSEADAPRAAATTGER